MYALHFYSGTHTSWLRDKANTARSAGLALYVTEFGTSQASGDGGP
jgi:endoglucanase